MTKSARWLEARAQSARLHEARQRALRLEKVLNWEKQVPDILNEYVPVLSAVRSIIDHGLGEGKSERTLMRWIQEARDHQSIGDGIYDKDASNNDAVEFSSKVKALSEVDPANLSDTTLLSTLQKLEQILQLVNKS